MKCKLIVICIERSDYQTQLLYNKSPKNFSIEVGDRLEVYDDNKTHYGQTWYSFIKNDLEWFTQKSKYITLEQFRENQLKEIFT